MEILRGLQEVELNHNKRCLPPSSGCTVLYSFAGDAPYSGKKRQMSVYGLHFEASDGRFVAMIQNRIRSRANTTLAKLELIDNKYGNLKAAIQTGSKRQKRGMVDGGGKVLNWLFGVETDDALDKINTNVELLPTGTNAMAHAIEAHASLVNETLWELQANAEKLLHLEATCSAMEKELTMLEQRLDYASETHWLAWSKMDEAF